MTRLLSLFAVSLLGLSCVRADDATPLKNVDGATVMPPAPGPFKGTVASLKQYECPTWFRDAKFGLWAHWGPAAGHGPAAGGDWYARRMYQPDQLDYQDHLKTYGHPSVAGYKDLIPLWKAEKFDPNALMALYKKAGAHYFVSMGVHHDNFDLWNSKFHRWNAVKMGPKQDIVGEWQKAAKAEGLPFGVSEHLGISYNWYQPAHGSDKTGPMAGIPYDGANPAYQDLYQRPEKPPEAGVADNSTATLPGVSHTRHGALGGYGWYTSDPLNEEDWQRRIHDLIDSYHPDLLYTDGGLPFGAVGRSTVAHLYNTNIALHDGKLEAVYNCKNFPHSGEFTPGTCVQDVERGGMKDIQPYPWQTDTSNGSWFYHDDDKYKTTGEVLHLLADIVSKNGNLLLNIVLKPDGTLPPESRQLLDGLAAWMKVNAESIFGTRPWVVYGEGPTVVAGGAFKEDFPFTAKDIRFTKKGDLLYAICMGVPTEAVTIKSLATGANETGTISNVTLLGYAGKLKWKQTADGLVIQPVKDWPTADAVVFRINGALSLAAR